MKTEMKGKSKIHEALAIDNHFSSYQITFTPDEALEFARQLPAVGKVTADRLVALIERINSVLPFSVKGRRFHTFRMGREENRFIGVPQTVADLSLERGRLLSVRIFEGDLPKEYQNLRSFSDLIGKVVEIGSEFKCSKCATDSASDCGGDLTEIKFFWK